MRYRAPYRLMTAFVRPGGKINSAEGIFASDGEARKAAARLFGKNRAIGAALGLFDAKGPVGIVTWGSAGHGRDVVPNTFFRVASVSKMVTAALAAGMILDGRLDADRDAADYLGVPLRADKWPDVPVTPAMLMSHTASVNDTDVLFHPELSLADAVRRLSFTGEKPGEAFRYSNEGAALLGAVLEKASGQDLDALFAAEFGTSGTFFPSRLPPDAHMSDGIRLLPTRKTLLSGAAEDRGDPPALSAAGHWNRAHGGLCLRAEDAVKIGVRLMTDGRYAALRREVIPMGERDPGITEGMGMFVIRYAECGGKTVYGHQGLAYGASHGIFFAPESGKGVVILTSGCSLARDHVLTDLNRDVIRAYL